MKLILATVATLSLSIVQADVLDFKQTIATGNPSGGPQYVDSVTAFAPSEYDNYAPVGYMFSLLGGQTPAGPSGTPGHSAVLRGYRSRPDIASGNFTQVIAVGGNTGTTPSLYCGATHITSAPSFTSGTFVYRPIVVIFTNPCGSTYISPRVLSSQIFGAEAIEPSMGPVNSVNIPVGSSSFEDIVDSAVITTDHQSGFIFGISETAGSIARYRYLNDQVSPGFGPGGLTLPKVIDATSIEYLPRVPNPQVAVVSSNKLSLFQVDRDTGALTLDSTLTNTTHSCVLGINSVSLTSNTNILFISSVHPVNGGAIHRLTRSSPSSAWTCGATYKRSNWTTPSIVPVLSDESPNPDKNLLITISGSSNMLQLVEWTGSGYLVRNEYLNGPLNNPMRSVFGVSHAFVPNDTNTSGATGMSVFKLYKEFRDGFED